MPLKTFTIKYKLLYLIKRVDRVANNRSECEREFLKVSGLKKKDIISITKSK